MTTRKYHRTNRRRWGSMPNRMLLIAPAALAEQMEMRGWSNRRLAKYAECAPGTIDNLMNGRTKGVNNPRTAELICEAMGLPMSLVFAPEKSTAVCQTGMHSKTAA
ncbi:helix-turn-helix transcriptional regulator [Brachybacterium sp. HMSC06H03]|uniref:helix-turn-helix domain-containing protein n=1 Tax=Brachybacterium sp. HMSC06H03 TaxID=1581127 RepID=UPI00114CACCA|nr:helix-turn-helix transcriptional regulator [Brachybacterium sp. HMSC06H03]